RPSLLGRIGRGMETGLSDIGQGLRQAAPLLGKVGETAGVAAGQALIPTVMPFIPGTPQHAAYEEIGRERKAGEEARTGLETAEAEKDRASESQYNLVPVDMGEGQEPIMVHQRDAERMQAALVRPRYAENTTRQKTASAANI